MGADLSFSNFQNADLAALQRLTITVNVTYLNTQDDSFDFEAQRFSFYMDYDPEKQDFNSIENDLIEEIYDVIIVGAGAAGLTAGIYSSRAKLSTLILNEGAIGGQMILTEEIANYPGVEATKGYILANTMTTIFTNHGVPVAF